MARKEKSETNVVKIPVAKSPPPTIDKIPLAKSHPPVVDLAREYRHPEYGVIPLLPLPGYSRLSGRAVFLRPDDMVYIMGGIGWKRADQIIDPAMVCVATSLLFVCVMRKDRE